MKKCTQSCREEEEAIINVLFTVRSTIYIEHWTSSSKILSNDDGPHKAKLTREPQAAKKVPFHGEKHPTLLLRKDSLTRLKVLL